MWVCDLYIFQGDRTCLYNWRMEYIMLLSDMVDLLLFHHQCIFGRLSSSSICNLARSNTSDKGHTKEAVQDWWRKLKLKRWTGGCYNWLKVLQLGQNCPSCKTNYIEGRLWQLGYIEMVTHMSSNISIFSVTTLEESGKTILKAWTFWNLTFSWNLFNYSSRAVPRTIKTAQPVTLFVKFHL